MRLGKKCGKKSARDKDLHAGGGVCIDENSRFDGELVEKGSNVQLWQSGREAMLRFEILCVLNPNQTLEAPDNLIFAWYRCLGHTSRPCMSAEDRLK